MLDITKRPSRKQYIGICIGILVISGTLSIFALPVVSKMIWSYAWQAVPAMVQDHAIECRHRRRNIFSCSGTVQYRYTLGSEEYVSSRLNVSPSYHKAIFQSEALAYLQAHYPIGSTTKAYVHPNNPSYAVLERGISDPLFFLLLSIVTLMPIGAILGLIFGTRSSVFALNPTK